MTHFWYRHTYITVSRQRRGLWRYSINDTRVVAGGTRIIGAPISYGYMPWRRAAVRRAKQIADRHYASLF